MKVRPIFGLCCSSVIAVNDQLPQKRGGVPLAVASLPHCHTSSLTPATRVTRCQQFEQLSQSELIDLRALARQHERPGVSRCCDSVF